MKLQDFLAPGFDPQELAQMVALIPTLSDDELHAAMEEGWGMIIARGKVPALRAALMGLGALLPTPPPTTPAEPPVVLPAPPASG